MFTPLARTRRQESDSKMSKTKKCATTQRYTRTRTRVLDKSYRLFAVTSVTFLQQTIIYQQLTHIIHDYFNKEFSLFLSPSCFIKGKLLCYFRYSASVTYFGTLLSSSSSRTCILSHYQALIRDAVKTNFATPSSYAPFFTSTSVLIAYLHLYPPLCDRCDSKKMQLTGVRARVQELCVDMRKRIRMG